MTDSSFPPNPDKDSSDQTASSANLRGHQVSVGNDVIGRDQTMVKNINTEGGAFIEGEVKAESDFVGRDQTKINAGGHVIQAEAGATVIIDSASLRLPLYYPTAATSHSQVSASPKGRSRIFISYKRDTQMDEPLALHLYEVLGQQHEVFIDQQMVVGMEWRERIQAELEACDFLVPLLSEESVHSEMVEYEISAAHHLNRSRAGKPRILPIRVAYLEPFAYPLNAYLNHLNWAVWDSESDTVRLVDELLMAISGGELSVADVKAKAAVLQLSAPSPIPRPHAFANVTLLERPEGTMDPESKFYIERPGDETCRRELARQGVTIVIKAPRQMGKSSLLVRAAEHAKQVEKAVAFLDFQLFDESALNSPEIFFKTFCHWLADELNLDDQVEDSWKSGLGHVQRCTKYVNHHVLKVMDHPIVLTMDEVDRMLDCPFRSDFFGMLRSWHNSRRANNEWRRLDLLLVISTEPYLLIENLKQSPFNVGEVIRLDDFTLAQVADLNARHGDLFSAEQLEALVELLGGHPYLVRQAMYRVACGEYGSENLLADAINDTGPFGDHLRRHLARFNDQPELIQAMRQIVQHQVCRDEKSFYRLHGAGLVRREGQKVWPRCKLYTDYFHERLRT
jgi:hypothetical protein